MAQLSYRDAVARGIAQEMARDESVVFLGEDVGAAGGVFKATPGLLERFGPSRVRDTPISEQAIVGAAMGAAMTGLRPIAELMFADFFAVCWDLVANEIAKSRYMTDGQVSFPLVIRSGNELVVITKVAGATAIESAWLAVWLPLSARCSVKLADPDAEGVPVMAPVLAFKLSPLGSEPTVTDQV